MLFYVMHLVDTGHVLSLIYCGRAHVQFSVVNLL